MRKWLLSIVLLSTFFVSATFFAPQAQAAVCGDTVTHSDGKTYRTRCRQAAAEFGEIVIPLSGCHFSEQCFATTKPDCSGCRYGRKLYCATLESGGGNYPMNDYTCEGAFTSCFLGEFASYCPQESPPEGKVCGLNQSNGKMTYCSISCGGNPITSDFTGCNDGTYCCEGTNPGSFEEWKKVQDFDYCTQVPDGAQRQACIDCVGSSEDGKQAKIYTAVGCIRVSGDGLTEDLVRLLLGISGGIALLTILGGAFLLSTSQGEVSKVKKAREMITAAVLGILFIIFSIIILNFVGVRILRIPGLI